jgi:hypothetical protein
MSTTSSANPETKVQGRLLENLIEALAGRASQIDLSFNRTSIGIPRLRTNLELNGTISVTVHMRDMTDSEKEAYAQRASAALTLNDHPAVSSASRASLTKAKSA